MSFNVFLLLFFSVFSSGGNYVQPSETILAMLVMMSSGLTTHQPMRVICIKMVY